MQIQPGPLAQQPALPRKRGRPKGSKSNPENPNVRRPVGRPRGSGRRQREAAAQAAERAALGLGCLAQTPTAQNRPVGRPRKAKEDSNGVFVELRASVSLLAALYFVCKFDGLSGHTRIPTHANGSTERI